MPDSFSIYALELASEGKPELRWWEHFGDRELEELIRRAYLDNHTLAQAAARLAQARAIAVRAGADLYPDLTGSGSATFSRRRIENGSANTSGSQQYLLSLASSYEVDLWGKIRATEKAALIRSEASLLDYRAAAITLAAVVADRWINIISQRMQKRLLESQIEINQTYLDLIELRFRQAMVSVLDVYQQRQVIDDLRAQIPLVEARERVFTNDLAVLLGQFPQEPVPVTSRKLPKLQGLPPTGIPADLLMNRPDVTAARVRLEAAGWDTVAARADRLPSLSLTGGAAVDSGDLGQLADNWLLSILGGFTAPILDGGRRAAEVDRAIALEDENLAAFRAIFLEAVSEVEDALVIEARQIEHIQALEREIETAQKALEQATFRYRNGLTDYLPVLTQLLSLQNLERVLIQQKTALLTNRVSLYRALGGGWFPMERHMSQQIDSD